MYIYIYIYVMLPPLWCGVVVGCFPPPCGCCSGLGLPVMVAPVVSINIQTCINIHTNMNTDSCRDIYLGIRASLILVLHSINLSKSMIFTTRRRRPKKEISTENVGHVFCCIMLLCFWCFVEAIRSPSQIANARKYRAVEPGSYGIKAPIYRIAQTAHVTQAGNAHVC